MACPFNDVWTLDCNDAIGGIQRILVKSFDPAQTYTFDTDGKILTGAISETFYEFFQKPELSGFNFEGQTSNENGTTFYNQTLDLVFHKYQAKLRDLLYALAITPVTVLVQSQTGLWFIMGEKNGAYTATQTGGLGKAYGDLNGANVQMLAKNPTAPREATPAYIATLTIVSS